MAQIQCSRCPCAVEARRRHGGQGQVKREAERSGLQLEGRGHRGRPAAADAQRAAGAEPALEPQRAQGSADTLILYLALAEFREMKCPLLRPASEWCLVRAAMGNQYNPRPWFHCQNYLEGKWGVCYDWNNRPNVIILGGNPDNNDASHVLTTSCQELCDVSWVVSCNRRATTGIVNVASWGAGGGRHWNPETRLVHGHPAVKWWHPDLFRSILLWVKWV